MQVCIKTFGCKVNFADSEELAAQLHSQGIAASADSRDSASDLCIINTCCVTAAAVKKARQCIRRLQDGNPSAQIIVTGCAAREESIARELAELGVRLVPDAESLLALVPASRIESADAQTTTRTRRFIKVQDGCNSYCSYCIVPFVRTLSSVPVSQVLDRVSAAAAEGAPEIVLCGTNIGLYGDGSGVPLTGLLEQVLAVLPATTRLRLSSIEPQHVDDALLSLMRHPQMCPHLHLPLQSGSDRVLRDMRRPYTASGFTSLVHRFREQLPQGAVTTDIMVGYPTETGEDFEQTLELVRECAFERAHLFRFSSRPQTKAAELKLLPSKEVRHRLDAIKRLVADTSSGSLARFLSKECTVALEGRGRGYGEAYQQVNIPRVNMRVGLYRVLLEGLQRGIFTGRLV